MIVDAHLDIAYNAALGRDPTRPAREQIELPFGIASVGLPDLRAGGVGLICATIFAQPVTEHAPWGYRDAEGAHQQALGQLDWYRKQVQAGLMRMVKSRDDLPSISDTIASPASDAGTAGVSGVGASPTSSERGRGAPATTAQPFIILMEGADPIRALDDVTMFYNAGVRIVGLAWKRTRYAGGTSQPGPLTLDGREVVRELDRLGIIHDASHLAEESFWNLLDLTSGPVIASHSNCRAIVPGDRHLSDEMIRALASRGGVIGINFFDKFLIPPEEYGKRRATLKDVVRHIQHMCDLVGDADHVGIGTDMDGGLGKEQIPTEIRSSAHLACLADALAEAKFTDEDIKSIMGDAWLRLFIRGLPL